MKKTVFILLYFCLCFTVSVKGDVQPRGKAEHHFSEGITYLEPILTAKQDSKSNSLCYSKSSGFGLSLNLGIGGCESSQIGKWDTRKQQDPDLNHQFLIFSGNPDSFYFRLLHLHCRNGNFMSFRGYGEAFELGQSTRSEAAGFLTTGLAAKNFLITTNNWILKPLRDVLERSNRDLVSTGLMNLVCQEGFGRFFYNNPNVIWLKDIQGRAKEIPFGEIRLGEKDDIPTIQVKWDLPAWDRHIEEQIRKDSGVDRLKQAIEEAKEALSKIDMAPLE
jgi:hypothetical protein